MAHTFQLPLSVQLQRTPLHVWFHKCGAPVLGLLTAHWRNRQVNSLTTQPRPWREALQSPRAQNSTWSFDQEVTFVLLGNQTLREPLGTAGRQGRSNHFTKPSICEPFLTNQFSAGGVGKGKWEEKPSPVVLILRGWVDLAYVGQRVCFDGEARLSFGMYRIGGKGRQRGLGDVGSGGVK